MERVQDEHRPKDIGFQEHHSQCGKQHFGTIVIGKEQGKCIWSLSF